jgi:hypothetical protein
VTLTASLNKTSLQVGLPQDVTIARNLTVGGDLTINGSTTIIDTTNLSVEDQVLKACKSKATFSSEICGALCGL